MNKFFFLFLLVASANCFYIDNGEAHKDKIVGGGYSSIEALPYQAQILINGVQTCGGSIISEYWILSAAHCFDEEGVVTVTTGSKHRGKGKHREVKEIIVHAEYDSKRFDNDIALIKLKKPIKFNAKQKPIAITTTPTEPGQKIKISGFGFIRDSLLPSNSPLLKAALAPVVSPSRCQDITENAFCAGRGATDACNGDSGGPAVIDNELVGIISWGYACASFNAPGVYTELYRYREWVANNTGLVL